MRIVLDTNCLIQRFVDCAIAANARYVVTNDKHFDILAQTSFPKVDIIELKDFAALL